MGNVFGMIPGLEPDEWSNDACRGYVIMAMEDCGFSKKDIRRVVGSFMKYLTSIAWRTPKKSTFPVLTDLWPYRPEVRNLKGRHLLGVAF